MPTLKEVADHVGVHPSTVSRALDPARANLVNPQTRARVRAAAEEWAERFGDHRPARSAIEATDFGRKGENARFMIEATAYRG